MASRAGTETELKLLVPVEVLDAMARAEPIETAARNRGTVRNLVAVYYDTPGHALWKAGFNLRVRRSGRRHILTVKSNGSRDGLLGRDEWEVDVAGFTPDPSPLAEVLPKKFLAAAADGAFVPIVSTEIRRRTRMLDITGATVELAVDHGRLVAGDRSEPISEIELELKSGEARRLYELGLSLLAFGPADPGLASKGARGFDLAFDRAPAWSKGDKSPVGKGASLDDAFAATLGAALRQFIENKPAARDGRDPEGVHQARVALRRLRSVLKVLGSVVGKEKVSAFGQEARWLASQFGEARNWDVFLTETLPRIEAACPDPDGFATLRTAADAARAHGYGECRAALDDARAMRFQLELALWIEIRGWSDGASGEATATLAQSAAVHAAKVLENQHGKVLKRGRRFEKLDAERRHKLRLAVKKLRYVADFLLPICATGKKAAAYRKALSALQDGLGRFNDAATTEALVIALAGDTAPADLHRACGVVRGWQARDGAVVEQGLRGLWASFATVRRPWP